MILGGERFFRYISNGRKFMFKFIFVYCCLYGEFRKFDKR